MWMRGLPTCTYYIMCVSHHVCSLCLQKTEEAVWIPWNQHWKWLWVTIWMLGSKARSCARASRSLKYWATTSGPMPNLFLCGYWRAKLRSSYLCSRDFTYWTIFPVPDDLNLNPLSLSHIWASPLSGYSTFTMSSLSHSCLQSSICFKSYAEIFSDYPEVIFLCTPPFQSHFSIFFIHLTFIFFIYIFLCVICIL